MPEKCWRLPELRNPPPAAIAAMVAASLLACVELRNMRGSTPALVARATVSTAALAGPLRPACDTACGDRGDPAALSCPLAHTDVLRPAWPRALLTEESARVAPEAAAVAKGPPVVALTTTSGVTSIGMPGMRPMQHVNINSMSMRLAPHRRAALRMPRVSTMSGSTSVGMRTPMRRCTCFLVGELCLARCSCSQ